LPFVIAAPGSFYRDVVTTQLARVAGSGRIPFTIRLADLTGGPRIFHGWLAVPLAIGIAAVVIAALARSTGHPTTFEWFAVGSTVGVAALLMLPAQFYGHYAAFIAPFLAIAVASAVGLLVPPTLVRTGLAIAALGLIALTANHVRVIGGEHAADRALSIDAVIPAGACALADSPADLITADRFVSASPGCGVLSSIGWTACWATTRRLPMAPWAGQRRRAGACRVGLRRSGHCGGRLRPGATSGGVLHGRHFSFVPAVQEQQRQRRVLLH